MGIPGRDERRRMTSAGRQLGHSQRETLLSFWSLLKRGYISVFHYMSVKHPFRYVSEFAGRENAGHNTMAGIDRIIAGAEGRRLDYRTLIR